MVKNSNRKYTNNLKKFKGSNIQLKKKNIKYNNNQIENEFNIIHMKSKINKKNGTKFIHLKKSFFDFKLNIFFIFIFFILSFQKILSKKNLSNLRKLNFDLEIILSSYEEITYELMISPEFIKQPDAYSINEELINGQKVHNAVMIWNNQLTTCSGIFLNLENAIKIDFSNFDFSMVTDMSNMFKNCKNLEKINFGNSKAAKIFNMDSTFYNCNNLRSIDLSNFDTSLVTTMENLFYGCNSITSLDLSTLKTPILINMGSMFMNCYSLMHINFSNFDTSKVTNMSYTFNNCNSLISLDISGFSTINTINMEHMFSHCINLVSINMSSNFMTNSVKNMSNMFSSCTNLESLDLSIFMTASVTNMESMFYKCENLIYLDLTNFNTAVVTTMEKMFYGCTSLIFINLNSNVFIEKDNLKLDDIFTNTPNDLIFCINQQMSKKILNELSSKNTENDCSNICFSESKSINVNKKKCEMDCSKNNDSNYNYNNTCYESCPKRTKISSYNNFICEDLNCENYYNYEETDCLTSLPEGYYLKDEKLKTIEKCHSDCKSCNKGEEEGNTNCLECKDRNKYLSKGNCIDKCEKDYYIDNFNNKICTCENDIKCKECSEESINLNLCISCNKGYYQKFNEKYNNSFVNCYKDLDGYYLVDNYYYRCYSTCRKCTDNGDKNNHKCDECIDNYIFINETNKENNCYEKCKFFYYFDNENEYKCSDLDICPYEYSKLIIEKNKCIDECNKDDTYLYEYNNRCYINCPNGTLPYNYTCLNEEKYSDQITNENSESSEIINTEEKSENNMKTDNLETTDDNFNTNIIQKSNINIITDIKEEKSDINFKTNNIFEKTSTNIETNFEEKINGSLETDIKEQIDINKNTEKIEQTYKEEKTYLNEDDNTNSLSEKSQNNSIFDNWSIENFFHGKYNSSELNILNKDDIIKNIKENIINHKIDTLLSGVTKGEKEDILIKDENILYQITTTDNQNSNLYNNISTIKLGDCEDILKQKYNISKNETLIILKIDYYMEGLLIPIIGYEVYHPIDKSKLNLSYCEESSISYNIPVSIDEDNLYKYDPNSDFYNDECYSYTTEDGTDILLNDRKEEFNDKNMSLCENICTFTGYDSDTKKALCECSIRYQEFIIEELNKQTNLLANNFTTDNSNSNLGTLKCYEVLFTKKGLLTNIGSYILLFHILLFIISSLLFYKIGYPLLENNINSILKQMEINKSTKSLNLYSKNIRGNKIRKTTKKKTNKNLKEISNPLKKSKISNKLSNKISYKNLNLTSKKENYVNSKVLIYPKKYKEEKFSPIFIKEKKEEVNIFDIDYEINSLPYKEAIKYDKRTYFEYYLSLIRSKHPLISTFCLLKDFNNLIIKINIFFLSFTIYFGINSIFFNNSVIHKIYEKEGKYDIIDVLPGIFISFIISYTINIFIRIIFLSERELLEIKTQKTLIKAKRKAKLIKKCFIIKYFIFFVFGNLFLILLWYYLSSFCAVYKNSQIFLFYNTIISFGLCLFFSFVFNLIPGIFRIYSLRNYKENKECIYKFSKIIQNI